MTCQQHEGQNKRLACLTCYKCVCETCIDTKHAEHKLFSLSLVAKDMTKTQVEWANNPSYTQLEEDDRDIRELCKNQQKITDKSKQVLYDRRDNLKKLLDEVTQVMVTKLDQDAEKLDKDLNIVKQKAADQIQTVKEYREGVARLQTLDKPLDVVEQAWRMVPPEITKLDFPKLSRLSFNKSILSANGSTEDIETLLGELVQQDVYGPVRFYPDGTFSSYDTGLSDASSVLTLDLFGDGPEGIAVTDPWSDGQTDVSTWLKSIPASNSLQCEVNLVYQRSFKFPSTADVMRPTPDGSCWVRCYKDSKKIILVNNNGEIQHTVPFKTIVADICVSPVTNQVLLVFPHEKCIKQIVNQSKPSTKTVIRTDPLQPYFMCGTPNGDLLVTLIDKTSLSVEPNSTSVLVKYNNEGKELARAHKDAHGADLFYIPFKVSISHKGTVGVINFTSKSTSHLVLLDNNLTLTLRYIDHGFTIPADEQLPTPPKPFCIYDVIFNHDSLILISEHYSRTVQLMDSVCNPLKVLLTEDAHVPMTLALHTNGDVWVSLSNRTIKVYNCDVKFTSDHR